MIKKMALLMLTFLVFDRFIQHKIDDGNKQRLAALKKQEQLFNKKDLNKKYMSTRIS